MRQLDKAEIESVSGGITLVDAIKASLLGGAAAGATGAIIGGSHGGNGGGILGIGSIGQLVGMFSGGIAGLIGGLIGGPIAGWEKTEQWSLQAFKDIASGKL